MCPMGKCYTFADWALTIIATKYGLPHSQTPTVQSRTLVEKKNTYIYIKLKECKGNSKSLVRSVTTARREKKANGAGLLDVQTVNRKRLSLSVTQQSSVCRPQGQIGYNAAGFQVLKYFGFFKHSRHIQPSFIFHRIA